MCERTILESPPMLGMSNIESCPSIVYLLIQIVRTLVGAASSALSCHQEVIACATMLVLAMLAAFAFDFLHIFFRHVVPVAFFQSLAHLLWPVWYRCVCCFSDGVPTSLRLMMQDAVRMRTMEAVRPCRAFGERLSLCVV